MKDEEQDEHGERQYVQGSRRAWLTMLAECLRQLGYDDPAVKGVAWVKEREDAVLMLRQVCERHGDNNWPVDLYLADIIDKHLDRHLTE